MNRTGLKKDPRHAELARFGRPAFFLREFSIHSSAWNRPRNEFGVTELAFLRWLLLNSPMSTEGLTGLILVLSV